MFTKKMIQSIIDFTGTEYHKKITNKEWQIFVNRMWQLHKQPSRHGVEQ